MKNLGKLSFIVVSYLLLQNPAIAADSIEIKQEGNNIIIIKNGQRKIVKDIPKQEGWLSLRETLETIKKILGTGDKRTGNSNQSKTAGVNELDISKAEKFHFCYLASKPITLWHPDAYRNDDVLVLQKDGSAPVEELWPSGEHIFTWTNDILSIENGVTYTINIGDISPRVTLHQVSDYVVSNDNYKNYEIGQEILKHKCARQVLFLVLPDDVVSFWLGN